MIKNYITTAIRNIYKNKVYSLLNIIGLAIGVMAFTMIMLYVQYETSYDKESPNADRIYRVYTRGSLNGDFEFLILAGANIWLSKLTSDSPSFLIVFAVA